MTRSDRPITDNGTEAAARPDRKQNPANSASAATGAKFGMSRKINRRETPAATNPQYRPNSIQVSRFTIFLQPSSQPTHRILLIRPEFPQDDVAGMNGTNGKTPISQFAIDMIDPVPPATFIFQVINLG